jgi:membrane protein implicated in regulation of membrane protease activity
MNWLWIGVIGIYVNFAVFLFTDLSLLYFFALAICLALFIWKMTRPAKRGK